MAEIKVHNNQQISISKAKGFIRYQIKGTEKTEYASFVIPQWVNKKKVNKELYLGRLINKQSRIFFNRKNGYFKFDTNNQIIELTDNEINYYSEIDSKKNVRKGKIYTNSYQEKPSIITFGNSYILYNFYKSTKLGTILKFENIKDHDNILSLIFYKIIESKPYCYAQEWFNSNYSRFLFPNASLESQRISEILSKFGTEENTQLFFNNYLDFIQKNYKTKNILVDSTGLPNNIKCPLTAINNHNGIKSKEIRLITVYDKISMLPIYYRYVPGNIVDVSTLNKIIIELKEYGLNIDRLILDAGYYSEKNLELLFNLNIEFMTRMVDHKGLYDYLITNYGTNILSRQNLVRYGDRSIFIKKTKTDIFKAKIPVFAYVCYDPTKQYTEMQNYLSKINDTIDEDKFLFDIKKYGYFIIISSMDININDVLPHYYSRQSIEQYFDKIKNDIDIIPLRTHTTQTFSGHMLICFFASILSISIDNILKLKNLSFIKSIYSLGLLNGHVYKKKIVPDISTKKVNNILKALKITIPNDIPIN